MEPAAGGPGPLIVNNKQPQPPPPPPPAAAQPTPGAPRAGGGLLPGGKAREFNRNQRKDSEVRSWRGRGSDPAGGGWGPVGAVGAEPGCPEGPAEWNRGAVTLQPVGREARREEAPVAGARSAVKNQWPRVLGRRTAVVGSAERGFQREGAWKANGASDHPAPPRLGDPTGLPWTLGGAGSSGGLSSPGVPGAGLWRIRDDRSQTSWCWWCACVQGVSAFLLAEQLDCAPHPA